jgi:hypothetical protein
MRASALVLAILLSAAPALGQVQKVQGVAGGYPVRVDVVSGGGGGGDATAANQTTEIARLTSILSALGGGLPAALVGGALSVTGPLTDAQLRAAAVPVSAASLPLPTGAATSALQTSIDATLTLINAALAKLTISQGAALGTNTVAMSGCSVTTAAPSHTTGTIQPCSLDISGRLRTAPTGTLTPADGVTNPTTLIGTQAFLMAWNPNINAWDRVFAEGIQGDNDNGPASGLLSVENYPMVFDGTNWDRWRASSPTSGSARVLPHDGTNGVSITAASTAAVAADPALVVALSPNSPPPKEADITCSATLTNGSPTLTCSTLQGVGALGFYLAYGTGGTIATQATYDGTNYFAVSACPPSAPSSGCVSSLSATGQYVIPLAAYSAVRFSGSGLSGSHTVTARATAKTGWVQPTGVTTITASSLPLPTGAANAVAQGSTTSGQTGELMQGAVTTNAPTYTNGQTSPINMGTSGGLRTQQIGDSFTWISSAGSYGIRSGAGILRRIIVGSNVAGGINCYDNTAGSGTVIVSLTTTTSTPFNYVEVGAAFSTGLYCVTTGTGESFTVVYAPAT